MSVFNDGCDVSPAADGMEMSWALWEVKKKKSPLPC